MIKKFDTTTQETLLELEKTQKEFWNICTELMVTIFISVL